MEIRSIAPWLGATLCLAACATTAGNGATSSPTPTGTATGTPTGTPTPSQATGVGPGGGTLDRLVFAVVGDTRPALPDDLVSYPTDIITKIFADLEAENPKPAFGVGTGDYSFADPWSDEGVEQIDRYLTAASGFTSQMFYAVGNHECLTVTSMNCLDTNFGGLPNSFKNFMSKMVTPLGYLSPYYSFRVDAADGSWTSKFVIIAGNSWDADQAAWLDQILSLDTTYTFIVRHEDRLTTEAPAVTPSEAIMANHPYTLALVGHKHTYSYDPAHKEVITGNGGAPLTGSVDYGYTVIQQLENGDLDGKNYDYQSHAVIGSFKVHPDGTPAN